MFYETNKPHNLKHNPFKSCVIPRPIAWISTIDEQGIVNIGPYSYFNAISDIPPMIMFSSSKKSNKLKKDSMTNIEKNGEFVVNIVTEADQYIMSDSSTELEYGISEAELFNIPMLKSSLVKAPRIASSPINLECKYVRTIDLSFDQYEVESKIVIGHVVGIHIQDDIIENGKINVLKLKPVARLGYNEYTVVNNIIRIDRK